MKTKTFKIEVVNTSVILITVPETMDEDQFKKEWEEGLWYIDEGVTSIAKYAAEMAVYAPECNHDGIGTLVTRAHQLMDYQEHPYLVRAITTDEYTETEVLEEGEWK